MVNQTSARTLHFRSYHWTLIWVGRQDVRAWVGEKGGRVLVGEKGRSLEPLWKWTLPSSASELGVVLILYHL